MKNNNYLKIQQMKKIIIKNLKIIQKITNKIQIQLPNLMKIKIIKTIKMVKKMKIMKQTMMIPLINK